MTAREAQIAAVLAEHHGFRMRDHDDRQGWHGWCGCGEEVDAAVDEWHSASDWHRAHVAAALDAALTADYDEHSADWHAVSMIRDLTGCEGQTALTAWSALQPLIGHLQREAVAAQEGDRLAAVEAALETKFYIPSQYEEDALVYADRISAALGDPTGTLAKVRADALREAAEEIDALRYYEVPAMQLKNTHAALLRNRADRIEAEAANQ